jgi:hypothetical protein
LGDFDKAKINNTDTTILETDSTTGDVKSNIYYESGTLMHELGHTLGLGHGGNLTDSNSYKPNYLSVMNYNFQFPSPVGNRPLDYSGCANMPLSEKNINESKGIMTTCLSGEKNVSTWVGYHNLDQKKRCSPDMPYLLNKSLDWNGEDNISSAKLISFDIDCDENKTEVLTGYDDWKNIKYIINKNNADRTLPANILEIFTSPDNSTTEIINSPMEMNINNEKGATDLIVDQMIIRDNIVQTVNNQSESNEKTHILDTMGEGNSTNISIPSNATAGIVITNDTGSFVVSNSTNISIPSNVLSKIQVSNSTNVSIPSNATAGIVITNDTGSFVVSNSTNISIPEELLLIGKLDTSNIKSSLETGKIDDAINMLAELDKSSDSSRGGDPVGDLISDPVFQNEFNPQINNFKSVLEKQKC